MLIRNEIKVFAQGFLASLVILFGSALAAVALSISARPALHIAEILSVGRAAIGLVAYAIVLVALVKRGFSLTKMDKHMNANWFAAGLLACGVLCLVAEKIMSIA